MKHVLPMVVLACLLGVPVSGLAQQSRKAVDAAKRKEQIAREQKKEYQKARERTLKHRREIQTKETRDRMDVVHEKARKYNRKNDEKWWERFFPRHGKPRR